MRIHSLTRLVTHLAFLGKTQLIFKKTPKTKTNANPKHFLWILTKARIKDSQRTEKLLDVTTILGDENYLI